MNIGVEILDHWCGLVYLGLNFCWPLDSSLVFAYGTFMGFKKICIRTRISFTIIPEYPLRVRTMLGYDANSLSLTR